MVVDVWMEGENEQERRTEREEGRKKDLAICLISNLNILHILGVTLKLTVINLLAEFHIPGQGCMLKNMSIFG